MAYTTAAYRGFGNGTIEWTIEGLEQPASAYDSMRISTSDGKSAFWSDGTNFDYTQNHACGTTVTGYGYATYQGIEYSCGSASTYTENCAPPVDTTAPTIYVDFSSSYDNIFVFWQCTDSDFASFSIAIGNQSNGTYRTFYSTTSSPNSNTYVYADANNVPLTPNTTYYFKYNVSDFSGNVRYYGPVTKTTEPPNNPPPTPTNFAYSLHSPPPDHTYTISWTGSAAATSYRLDARKGTDAFVTKYSGTAASTAVTFDLPGTTYENQVYAISATGTSSPLVGYITTDGTAPGIPPSGTPVTPPPVGGSPGAPDPPSGLSIFRENPNEPYMDYYVSFSGSGAPNYRIDVRKTSDTQWYEKYNGAWANPVLRFDNAGTEYEVRVYACWSGTDNLSCSMPESLIFTTASAPDVVPPTINHTYLSHGTSIDANWSISDVTNNSATDTESGFDRAYLFMSGANVASPRNQMFLTYAAQGSFTLTVDGTGANITSQTTYTFHWEAYDVAGNKATTNPVAVTTTVPRPPNFAWNPAVISGMAYNMTANQWSFFTQQINAFRGYMSFAPYTFTNVFAGLTPTADHYNEARNAIYPMNGNIPPFRSPGETIYASDYNGLVTALNAVP